MNKNEYEVILENVNNVVYEILKNDSQDGLEVFFRGQANSEWNITSGVQRLDSSYNNRCAYESETINKLKMKGEWRFDRSLFENIAHLQHYGCKTRFIDFTTDINVALYFACSEEYDKDGAIFICETDSRNSTQLDTVLISNLVYVDRKISVHDFINKCNLPDSYKDEGILSIESMCDFGFMVKPTEKEREKLKKYNIRLYNQKGCFWICGNKLDPPDESRLLSTAKWIHILPELCDRPFLLDENDKRGRLKKIIIPKEYKKNIIYSLNMKRIGKNTIYPDK